MASDDDDVTPFSPSGKLPDPGTRATAYGLPDPRDPFNAPQEALTPEQFVAERLRHSEAYRRGMALKPHISTHNGEPFGPRMLRQAEVIDEYLTNGVGLLTADQIQLIIDVLSEPETPARTAANAAIRASWDRAVRDTIYQLRVEKVRKG